jgi:predicted phage terminase large subunit-like protein
MAVRELKPGSVDKLIRATPFINLCADGRVFLPEWAPWLDDALSELLRFTGDDKLDEHDDIVDTCGWAGQILTSKEPSKSANFRPFAVGVR